MQNETLNFIAHKALGIRIDSIRATTASKSGHPTSCLSAADMVATLFFNTMRFDLNNPHAVNNDRFILSKGHAIPMVYAAYKQLGVISDEELLNFRSIDSVLEGHPTPRFAYNEAATGSLGQGLSVGVGMALHAKKTDLDYTTYVMMGDGEIAEGSIWEAASLAPHYKLDNLVGIVDCNRLGQSEESLSSHDVEQYAAIFTAFGWRSIIIDGHNIRDIYDALEDAKNSVNQPTVLIAKTFKGHGLSAITNKLGFHGKPLKPQEAEQAIQELTETAHIEGIPAELETAYTPPLPTASTSPLQQETITLDLTTDQHTDLFNNDQKIATRKAFGYALAAAGRIDNRIMALDADVKNSTFTEIFEQEHPERFVQTFIAEQNMVGIATGLELRGNIPFSSTFAAFFSRAHDQIRMASIGRNALRLAGSHVGVSIGEDGPSQMGLEDIALMRSIPSSVVFYPSDGVSTYKLVEKMANYHDGISYIRTTRATTPILYDKNETFTIGGCKVLRQSEHDNLCIIGAGITLHEALKAHEVLKTSGINTAVIDLYSVKPFDKETVTRVGQASGGKILIVEDHYPEGGIGEAIMSELANENFSFKTLAVKEISRSGSPADLLKFAGIDADAIVKAIKSF